VGIVAGLIFSASTASMMASLLYGVRPHDPAVFLIVPLLLLAVAALASYLPARRYAVGPGCLRRNTVFPWIRRPEAQPDLVSLVQIWREWTKDGS